MPFYADLHIHSKHSRACSRDCDLEHLAWWAGRKGITLVGTGDFTHPGWLTELESTLVPAEPGLFRLRDDLSHAVVGRLPPACRGPVRFMLSVEISTIYKRADRTRKVHHLLYAPDFATAHRLNRSLTRIGNLGSDGRPILGLDSRDLLEITLESGPGAYLVPAHVWTPWFAVLGSMSGFDAVADCYGDLADHVFAVETGLSSDPAMNWRVSALDRYRLVSNSDAHSPPMLGREATVFATDLDYFAVRRSLETGEGFGGTVEFFPEEGKYHLDGHRTCRVRSEPEETRRAGGLCPGCGKPVTVGVLHRVEALADRPDGHRPEGVAGFRNLVPLPELCAEIAGVGAKSKTVAREVDGLVARLGPELGILERVPLDDLRLAGGPLLAEAVARLRQGHVHREAGYDGEYGVIRMFTPDELRGPPSASLFPTESEPVPAGLQPVPAAPVPTAAAAPVPAPAGGTAPDGVAGVLDGLDADQRAAAGLERGPVLIVAGPGTGKTRTLTHRLAHLVRERGVAPAQCLALTFTRRACAELSERLEGLVPEAASRMTVTTFHGLGLAIVREQHRALGLPADVRVADEAERLALLRVHPDAPVATGRRLLGELSALRRGAEGTSQVVEQYTSALRARGLVDFDDLALLPVRLLEHEAAVRSTYRARWTCLAVDEYQDVDALQYRLLRALAPDDGDLCAIGDPDQAIYGFRGGDVGFFLRFAEDFPPARRVQLTRNYRSSATIVAAALQAVAPDTLVPDRALTAVAPADLTLPVTLHEAASERAEAEFVVATIERLLGGSSYFSIDSGRVDQGSLAALSFADFALLTRTRAQLDPLAEALERAGMPFQQRTHDRLLDRPEVAAIVAALRGTEQTPDAAEEADVAQRVRAAAAGEEELHEAVELLDPLARRCGNDLGRFLTELSLGEEVDSFDPRADRIALLTLHAAKGLEFEVVFLTGCDDGLLPLRWGAECDLAEERRLFFVGMTRARSRLVLSRARRRLRHSAVAEMAPSPFLADIAPQLLERSATPPGPRARPQAPEAQQLSLL